MAKQTLQTNFVDDILEESMSGKRRYNLIQNDDGTVSLEDVTNYSQIGSSFGAAQVNAMNNAINESADKSKIIDNLSDIAANQQSGMMAGALAVRELNNKTIRLAELSHGDAGHEFSLSSAENKKYYSYVIAAKPRNTGFPWAYAITKNGSSSGVNYFYSTSYYFSLSATISDDKISFSKTWSKGVNNGLDILLSDIDVYVYGLE